MGDRSRRVGRHQRTHRRIDLSPRISRGRCRSCVFPTDHVPPCDLLFLYDVVRRRTLESAFQVEKGGLFLVARSTKSPGPRSAVTARLIGRNGPCMYAACPPGSAVSFSVSSACPEDLPYRYCQGRTRSRTDVSTLARSCSRTSL